MNPIGTGTQSSVEFLKEEYEALFNHICEQEGMSEERAVEMIKALPEENERYMRVMSGISVAIAFTEEDILSKYPEWAEMSNMERDKVLWQNGMDTKTNHHHKRLAWMTVATPEGYKKELIRVIYGQERLDSGWINKKIPINNGMNFTHYASEEALTTVWYRSHGRGAMFG